ncbi:uncharacterized protein LOC123679318 [Harmonia axyridis]|uniref:uncharacterized protein LOC123679318 n=1 Tax=Harmonia axyridis TaxID=115357 RepID=UPI001E2750A6|nr:uncharacterized protein LOC123679318 [Harmonia axyridis]
MNFQMVFGKSNSLFTDWERCYQNIITFLMKEKNKKEKTVRELLGTVSGGNFSENRRDASIVWTLLAYLVPTMDAITGQRTQPNIQLKILRDHSCLLKGRFRKWKII